MKKLVLSALCVSVFLFSCASASDESISETSKISENQARTSSITKTTEMINFESALKKYMQNKPYFDDAKLKEESEREFLGLLRCLACRYSEATNRSTLS